MLQESACVAGTIQIGQAAKLTALSIDAIRLYERRALLPTVPRTPGRFRLYTADDVSRLTLLSKCRALGSHCKRLSGCWICENARETRAGGQGTAEDETGQGPRHDPGAARIRTRGWRLI